MLYSIYQSNVSVRFFTFMFLSTVDPKNIEVMDSGYAMCSVLVPSHLHPVNRNQSYVTHQRISYILQNDHVGMRFMTLSLSTGVSSCTLHILTGVVVAGGGEVVVTCERAIAL